jgi:dTDP-4-amino-4,6-dideoxygalactose transaminase
MNDPKERKRENETKGGSFLAVPLALPWFTEEEPEAAYEVVKSKWICLGPKTEEFERQFAAKIGVKHAVAVNSGSSALLVVQAAAGIGRGDEVIVPNMTFVSTATSCMYLGAKPVFADINLSTYCIDVNEIEKNITPKTKAIIPVHYAGQSADMAEILEIARRHNLIVIEDAAEAHLSEYNGAKCGSIGKMGIFSFTPTKPMTTGEGGMITTDDDELATRCRLIRNFGDTAKFQWDMLGFNFRMPEVMGAMGLAQLKKVDEAVRIRREIAQKYTQAFSDIDTVITPYVRKIEDINFQLYTIRLKVDKLTCTRDEFIEKLSEFGVSARLYYPCLHRQKVFSGICEQTDVFFPNSIEYARTALSLPIFPEITEEQIQHVISSVRKVALTHAKS